MWYATSYKCECRQTKLLHYVAPEVATWYLPGVNYVAPDLATANSNLQPSPRPVAFESDQERMRESCRYLYALLKDNDLMEEWQEIVGRDLVGLTADSGS